MNDYSVVYAGIIIGDLLAVNLASANRAAKKIYTGTRGTPVAVAAHGPKEDFEIAVAKSKIIPE